MIVQSWNVITESLDLLEAAAESITEANRQAPTPCAQWTVTQVLQHAAGDQLAWAAAIGVGTGPSGEPLRPLWTPRRRRRRPDQGRPGRRPHGVGGSQYRR